jgi:Mor family transcriptional regulator
MTPITEHHYTDHPTPAQLEDQAIQLHREFVEILRAAIGFNEHLAHEAAVAVVRELRARYGGQTLGRKGTIYIPAPDKSERNAAIRAEFIGSNAKEICKKYGIGRTRLYEIAGTKP